MIIHCTYNADGNRAVLAINNSKEKITSNHEFQYTTDKNIATKKEALSLLNKKSIEGELLVVAKSKFAKDMLISLCNPAR